MQAKISFGTFITRTNYCLKGWEDVLFEVLFVSVVFEKKAAADWLFVF